VQYFRLSIKLQKGRALYMHNKGRSRPPPRKGGGGGGRRIATFLMSASVDCDPCVSPSTSYAFSISVSMLSA